MTAFRTLATLLVLLIGTCGAGAEDDPSPRARAIALYDAGRYAEASRTIGEIDRAGQADGALLYRWFYCQRAAADPSAGATLERARVALELELAAGASLETLFYLTNAYANLQRSSDAQRVAVEAVGAVESAAIPEPATPFGRFALGKLYADLRRADRATHWYEAALAAPGGGSAALAPAYVRWASRYLGDRALDAANWEAAERSHTRLVDAGEASLELYDRLAVSRARLGLWVEAAQAWRKADRLDPSNADRARYCARIVDQATNLGSLPPTAPDGRLWRGLSSQELEEFLAAQAQVVRSAKDECRATPGPDAARREILQTRLDAARALFVAAALEYALAGYNIRETAFVGGFAPLVFHADEWVLPAPPEEEAPGAEP